MKNKKILVLYLTLFTLTFIWSAIRPKDYFTWILEIIPALIALIVLFFSYKKFPLTNLCYLLVLIHSIILFVGGHYTYAEVPFFDLVKNALHQSRNNYDKIGHFAQGFIPAIITREILIRKAIINGKGWLNFICVCICLSISAGYEFIEWFVADATGENAEAFLGTQGYVWDTQSDMLLATLGAVTALVLLSKIHDKQLETVNR